MNFDEQNLRFSFDDSWQVVKYDNTAMYREGIGVIPDCKAVDFIGLQSGSVFFIEVKDFREHRIETQARLTDGELAIEVAKKVKDSIAGLVGAQHTSLHHEVVARMMKSLTDANREIKVVIWLEYDLPGYLPKNEKIRKSVEGNLFKKKLHWLTKRVLVVSMEDNGLQRTGLSVSQLAHRP